MVNITQYRQLKIEQPEPHGKKWEAVPAPQKKKLEAVPLHYWNRRITTKRHEHHTIWK